jgi:Putative DNA-binding domain
VKADHQKAIHSFITPTENSYQKPTLPRLKMMRVMSDSGPIDAYDLCSRVLAASGYDAGALVALASGECDWIEFKAASGPTPEFPCGAAENEADFRWNVAKAVLALANSSGGCVLLGVDDKGIPTGLGASDPKRCLEQKNDEGFSRHIVEAVLRPSCGWDCLKAGRIQMSSAVPNNTIEVRFATLRKTRVLAILVRPRSVDDRCLRCKITNKSGVSIEALPARRSGDHGISVLLKSDEEITAHETGRLPAREHFRWLLSRSEAVQNFADRFAGHVHVITPRTLPMAASGARIQEYHSGAKRVSWSVIQSEGLIERAEERELIERLQRENEKPRMFCVVGPMFSGKSTLAWRAAANLAQQGHDVLHLENPERRELWAELPQLCRKLARPLYVLVDDFYECSAAVNATLDEEESLPLTILATSRPGSVPKPGSGAAPGPLKCEQVRLQPLGDGDKEAFLRQLGTTVGDLDEHQRSIYRAARDMGALVQAVIPETELQSRAAQLVSDLRSKDTPNSEPGLAGVFQILCFCWQFGISVPIAVLRLLDSRFHGVEERSYSLNHVEKREGFLQPAAHPRFARLVSEAFYRYGSPPDHVLALLIAAIPQADIGVRFISNLLTAIYHSQEPILESLITTLLPLTPASAAAIGALASRPATILQCEALYRLFDAQGAWFSRRADAEHAESSQTKEHHLIDHALSLSVGSPGECASLVALAKDGGSLLQKDAVFAKAKNFLSQHDCEEPLWIAALGLLKGRWRHPELHDFVKLAFRRFPDSPQVLGNCYAAFNSLEDLSVIEDVNARHRKALPSRPVEVALKFVRWKLRAGDATGGRNELERCREAYAHERNAKASVASDWTKQRFEWRYHWGLALLDLGHPYDAAEELGPVNQLHFDAAIAHAQSVWMIAVKNNLWRDESLMKAIDRAFDNARAAAGLRVGNRSKRRRENIEMDQTRVNTVSGYFYVEKGDWKRALAHFAAASSHDVRYPWNYLGEAAAHLESDEPDRWQTCEKLLIKALGPEVDQAEWSKPRLHRRVVLAALRKAQTLAHKEKRTSAIPLVAQLLSLIEKPKYLMSMSPPYRNSDLSDDNIREGIEQRLKGTMFEAEVAFVSNAFCRLGLGDFPDKVFCHSSQWPQGQRAPVVGDRVRCEITIRRDQKYNTWNFATSRVELLQRATVAPSPRKPEIEVLHHGVSGNPPNTAGQAPRQRLRISATPHSAKPIASTARNSRLEIARSRLNEKPWINLADEPEWLKGTTDLTIYLDETWPKSGQRIGVLAGIVWKGPQANPRVLPMLRQHLRLFDGFLPRATKAIADLRAASTRAFPFIFRFEPPGGKTPVKAYEQMIHESLLLLLGWLLPQPSDPSRKIRVRVICEALGGEHSDGAEQTERFRGVLQHATYRNSGRFQLWTLESLEWRQKLESPPEQFTPEQIQEQGYLAYGDLLAYLALEDEAKQAAQLAREVRLREMPGYLTLCPDVADWLETLHLTGRAEPDRVLDFFSINHGSRLASAVTVRLRETLQGDRAARLSLLAELDRRYHSGARNLRQLDRQFNALSAVLGDLEDTAPLRLRLLDLAIRLQRLNHFGDPTTLEALERDYEQIRRRALENGEPDLVAHVDLNLAVRAADRFQPEKAKLIVAELLKSESSLSFLSRAKAHSSLGQYLALIGDHGQAREAFDLALLYIDEAHFDTEEERAAQWDQTAVYRAFNAIDAGDEGADDLVIEILARAGLGSLDQAVGTLAGEPDATHQFRHHLLLRWLNARQAGGGSQIAKLRSSYIAAAAPQSGSDHPWEIIALHRGLLAHESGQAESGSEWFLRAIEIALAPRHGPTLRVIAAMIATVAWAKTHDRDFQQAGRSILDGTFDGLATPKALVEILPTVAVIVATLTAVLDDEEPGPNRADEALSALSFNYR